MDLKKIIPMLTGICCFYDNEQLTLAGSDTDLSVITGYTPEEFENKFQNQLIGIILPDDRSGFFKNLHAQLEKSYVAELVFRMRHKNGRIIWVLAKIMRIAEEDQPEYLCGVMTDYTRYKKEQDNADNLMHQYQIILSQTQNVTFELDIPSDTISFSDTWSNLFSYTPSTRNFVATLPAKAHIHPADIPHLLRALKAMKKGESYKTLDLRISNGSHFTWFCLRATGMYDDDGKLLKIVGIILNIDEEKKAASLLQKKAERDSLTKLLNKEACKHQIEEYLNSFPNGAYAAMMVIDLDNFKQINDKFGHMFGDSVLLKATEAIRTCFRDRDIVARIGGDEFMVLMKDVSDQELVKSRCQKMLDTFQALLGDEKTQSITSFSIGVALSPNHGTTYERLFKCADEAMYEAKKQGKNHFALYPNKDSLYYY